MASPLRNRLRYPGIVGPDRAQYEPALIPTPVRRLEPASKPVAPRQMTMEAIPLNRMFVPDEYQRDYRPHWAKKIAKAFDPGKLTPLTVADRGDGRYAIVDGQHRWAALRIIHGESSDLAVWCNVGRFASIKDESDWFLAMNRDTYKVTGTTSFHARVHAGEPVALRMQEAATRHGFRIHTGSGHAPARTITSPALERLMRSYANQDDLVDATLRVLNQVVGERERVAANFIIGLGSFVGTYRDDPRYREDRLVYALNLTGTGKVLRDADTLRSIARSTELVAGRKAILMAYNHKLPPQNRLEEK